MHHSIGEENHPCARIFESVTKKVVLVKAKADAVRKINDAISTCMQSRKPVYLEVACNLWNLKVFVPSKIKFQSLPRFAESDETSLAECVEDLKARLNVAVRPVLIIGAKLLSADAVGAFV